MPEISISGDTPISRNDHVHSQVEMRIRCTTVYNFIIFLSPSLFALQTLTSDSLS